MPLLIIIQSIVQEGKASRWAVSSLRGKNWSLGGEKILVFIYKAQKFIVCKQIYSVCVVLKFYGGRQLENIA